MKRFLLFLFAFALASCGTSPAPSTTEVPMSLSLTSSAFASGQSIPAKYSCVGRNISPDLKWSGEPAGTQSFALIVDDPDAPMGTWVHWVAFNIPASTHNLPESVAHGAQLANGGLQGRNSSGSLGYDGPCPPSGTHRYFFKLYALDTTLNLSSGASKDQLLKSMQGHILAQGELMGTFSK